MIGSDLPLVLSWSQVQASFIMFTNLRLRGFRKNGNIMESFQDADEVPCLLMNTDESWARSQYASRWVHSSIGLELNQASPTCCRASIKHLIALINVEMCNLHMWASILPTLTIPHIGRIRECLDVIIHDVRTRLEIPPQPEIWTSPDPRILRCAYIYR